MFENLSDRLERSFKILKGEGKITEINVAETMKDVRRALLDADVNFKVAKEFTNKVKEKALGMNVLTAVKPGQLMVKLVHDELAELMGGEEAPLKLEGHPAIILMSGLQGSGKTTFSGKLANMLKTKKGKKPLLVACDVYRPAAIDQLKVVGEQVGVPVYSEPENKDVCVIADHAIQQAKTNGNDVVIVDTAGRLAIDEQGDGTDGSSSANYSNADKDIHALKLGKSKLCDIDDMFYGSFGYWTSLMVPLIAFIGLLIAFRRRAIENADIVKMRSNKANKIATKRLKKARTLMLARKQGEFYDEVLRALWGYVSYKLNMPVEQLSRENIQDKLLAHSVDADTIEKFTQALDECEFERYAPGDPAGNMNKTFDSAMTAIMEIENAIKAARKQGKKTSARQGDYTFGVVLLLIFMGFSLSASAVTKQNADTEYTKGNYQQAIKDYEDLLKNGVSPEVYYNLGNAYYRTDNITKAVLAYERAHLLSPGDEDINFNLQFARSKTIDKITPVSEMFFVTWYKALVNFTSVDNWAKTGIISIIMALLLVLLYLFGPHILMRKIGFFGGIGFFLVFLLSNLFAYQQKQALDNRKGAIIISPSVNIKKTPAKTSTDQFVLHEGTRVDIIDKGMTDWRGIRVGDGREGWIETKHLEEI